MSLLELFVDVDDFCKAFLPIWERSLLGDGTRHRLRKGQLTVSEIMPIVIYFHQSHYRDFKFYYTEHVCKQLRSEFHNLVSYPRFVALLPSVLRPLSAYLRQQFGRCTGISFIDSTTLIGCFQAWRSVERARWAGFMSSNCISWSMTAANCWHVAWRLEMSMIELRFLFYAAVSLASCSAIRAFSHNLYSSNWWKPVGCNSSRKSNPT